MSRQEKLIGRATTFLIVYSFVLSLGNSTAFPPRGDMLFITTLFVFSVISALMFFRIGRYLLALAAASAIAVALMNSALFMPLNENTLHFLKGVDGLLGLGKYLDSVKYVVDSIINGAEDNREAILKFLSLVTIASYFAITALEKTKKAFYLVLILPVYYIVLYLNYFDVAIVSTSLFFAGFTAKIFEKVEKRQIEKSRYSSDYFERHKFIRYATLLSVMLILLANLGAYLMPLKFINAALSGHIPHISSIRSEYEKSTSQYVYSFSQTIYQPDSKRLGGPIGKPSEDILITVESEVPKLYLRGKVKDIYTGTNWAYSKTSYKSMKNEADIKTLKSAEIKYVNIETATVFQTLETTSNSLSGSKLEVNTQNIAYYQANFLESKKWKYKIFFPIGNSILENVNDADYLSLSETITPRTVALARSLAVGAVSEREIIENIVEYLAKNHRYNLYAKFPPDGQDFVDFFLFDDKDGGYCTYFATAAVILARINGIEARYVEGFTTPSWPNQDGIYEIKAKNAHAWLEVYFDDEGWVSVEATPSTNQGFVDDEYYKRLIEERRQYYEDNPPITPGGGNHPTDDQGGKETPFRVKISWGIFFVAILGFPLFYLIRRFLPRPSMRKKFRKVLARMRKYNYSDIPDNVPEDFIFNYCAVMLSYQMQRSHYNLIQKYLYSRSISREESDILEDEMDKILGIMKKRSIKNDVRKQKASK